MIGYKKIKLQIKKLINIKMIVIKMNKMIKDKTHQKKEEEELKDLDKEVESLIKNII